MSKSLLQKIWDQKDEFLEKLNKKRAEKNLKMEAEMHYGQAVSNTEDCEAAFQDSLKEALNNPKKWGDIVNCKLATATAKRKEEESLATYEEVFGHKPKLAE